MNKVYFGDNLPILKTLPNESVDLIYIDPPFNTGKIQSHTSIKTIRNGNGDRKGFQGSIYQTVEVGTHSYNDDFNHNEYSIVDKEIVNSYRLVAPSASLYFLEIFLEPRIKEAYRILKPNGSFYFHIDYREAHYCKLLLDRIFGRECFINEIIWAYDYGAKSKTKWPTKHDSIFFYAKDPTNYIFNTYSIDREPYMAPGLVGKEKADRGKLPTDTWWHTIVGTNSKERTGYPTQKPLGIINRIIQASSLPGNIVLDFFAGSGTTGESCFLQGREFILIDNNIEALQIMAKRFSPITDINWYNFDPKPYQDTQVSSKQNELVLEQNDFEYIASLAKYFRNDLELIENLWDSSPFNWMIELPPARKGALAKKIITSWISTKGIIVEKSADKNCDISINGYKFVIKSSFLWENGGYKFQQIRDQEYDYVICFGISPFTSHCWVISKNEAIQHATPQHGTRNNSEFWLGVEPEKITNWLLGKGGSLKSAYEILKRISKMNRKDN